MTGKPIFFSNLTTFTLQKKYSVAFTIIFLVILLYILFNIFKSEEQDLIELSNKNFKTLFRVINVTGEEALSVGKNGRLSLQESIKEIFRSEVEGLEQILFVDKEKQVYAYFDHQKNDMSGTVVTDSLWADLEAQANKEFVIQNRVHLTQKMSYKTSNKEVFLGYSRLVFSLEHINQLIAKKQRQTLIIGSIGFSISLLSISLVTAFLIQRIKVLNIATKSVAQGKFNQLPVRGGDELSELTSSFNDMTVAVKERLMMTRYVSSSTIEQFKSKQVDELVLGGHREEQCLFFSDVRGFTSFSEQNTPDDVVQYLNELLNLQVEIIRRHQGDIDKFVGDEIMAVFRSYGKESKAIQAAIDIQQSMLKLAQAKPIFQNLRIGIGIHSGSVITGNIGSHDRMDFTSIGDAVNTAARLCSNAAANEIIISELVKSNLQPDEYEFSEPFTLTLKGKQTALNLYKVYFQTEFAPT